MDRVAQRRARLLRVAARAFGKAWGPTEALEMTMYYADCWLPRAGRIGALAGLAVGLSPVGVGAGVAPVTGPWFTFIKALPVGDAWRTYMHYPPADRARHGLDEPTVRTRLVGGLVFGIAGCGIGLATGMAASIARATRLRSLALVGLSVAIIAIPTLSGPSPQPSTKK